MTEQAIAPVLTIDGPSGSGKGTVAGQVAARLGWGLLDSGALYRLVALAALDAGVSADDDEGLVRLGRDMEVSFPVDAQGRHQVCLAGRPVDNRLRTDPVSDMASRVAAVPAVRQALVERQRAFRRPPGLVADGRDMGTVIFQDAPLKIFLTAGVEERARRRYKQLSEKGENVTLGGLFREIEARDARDRQRSVAPLRPAEDAIEIDSTCLSVEQVVERIVSLARQRQLI